MNRNGNALSIQQCAWNVKIQERREWDAKGCSFRFTCCLTVRASSTRSSSLRSYLRKQNQLAMTCNPAKNHRCCCSATKTTPPQTPSPTQPNPTQPNPGLHFGGQAVGEEAADARRDVPARRTWRGEQAAARAEGTGAPLGESLKDRNVNGAIGC